MGAAGFPEVFILMQFEIVLDRPSNSSSTAADSHILCIFILYYVLCIQSSNYLNCVRLPIISMFQRLYLGVEGLSLACLMFMRIL